MYVAIGVLLSVLQHVLLRLALGVLFRADCISSCVVTFNVKDIANCLVKCFVKCVAK